MDEYNKSIRACLPKHAVEMRRVKAAARAGHKQAYLDCRSRFSEGASYNERGAEAHYGMMCGSGKLEDGPVRGDRSPEEDELRAFNEDANSWCGEQFTKPKAP